MLSIHRLPSFPSLMSVQLSFPPLLSASVSLLPSLTKMASTLCLLLAQAYEQIEKMKSRRIVLGPYLDSQMVDDIYKHMGVQVDDDASGNVEEDIADDA